MRVFAMKWVLCPFAIVMALASPAAPADVEARVSACFTPPEDCTVPIVAAIDGARREILVQAYQMPYVRIAKALEAARGRGVAVRVLFDKSGLQGRDAALGYLTRGGIECRVDDALQGIAHNKVMVIDGAVVITGSYNFTHAGEYDNAENVVVMRSPALADAYRKNWLGRWAASRSIDH